MTSPQSSDELNEDKKVEDLLDKEDEYLYGLETNRETK